MPIPDSPAACDHDREAEPVTEAPRTQGATVTETIATTTAGMAAGVAALWFLAPICLTC